MCMGNWGIPTGDGGKILGRFKSMQGKTCKFMLSLLFLWLVYKNNNSCKFWLWRMYDLKSDLPHEMKSMRLTCTFQFCNAFKMKQHNIFIYLLSF